MIAIGDVVERVLTSVGITKNLAARIFGWRDCGCERRKSWLNQWGYRQQERLRAIPSELTAVANRARMRSAIALHRLLKRMKDFYLGE